MNVVITWVKANVYTVIFLLVMIAAGIAMPIVAGKMNASVRAENETRARKIADLDKLRKTNVADLGGNASTVLVNRSLIDAFRAKVDAERQDADSVYQAAVRHNRKGRGVLLDELFPEPPAHRKDLLPKEFHALLLEAYDEMLAEVGAGSPPDAAEVADFLERRQEQFLSSNVAGSSVDSLSDEDRALLLEQMSGARVARYVEVAESMNLYANADVLALPLWEQRLYGMDELFDWQWNYWVHEDLLMGLAAANGDADSVIEGPVKRIVSVNVRAGAALGAPTEVPSSGGGGSTSMGMGFGGGGGGGGGAKAPQVVKTPLNPKAEAVLNYTEYPSGRVTNPLYDVRYVDVSLVVDPVRIPQILDELARRNFITVVELELTEADPYADLREGYFYGNGRIARLDVVLETIWLREWTRTFMPTEVMDALGVMDPNAPPADDTQSG